MISLYKRETYSKNLSLGQTDEMLMDEYIPLGDTRYVFRISNFFMLTNKKQ